MAQIRQLCCLGLGREAAAPALVRLLLRLIPGFSASLFFSDENGELVNIYDENPALTEVGPLYVSEFYNGRDSDKYLSFTELFRRGFVGMRLDQFITVDRRTWERSDLYNLIFRPLGYDGSGLRLAVRDRGRPLFGVVISRGVGDAEFAASDLDLLVALEPYLAHAYVSSPSVAPLVESDAEEDQGLVITDREGRMRYLSPQARVLLFYATHDEVAPGKLRADRKVELPPPVVRLACMMAQVFEGKAPPAPPVHCHENGWGQFVFRAHWLEGEGAEPPLVGIRISRREPLPVRLLRRIDRLPLSERQVEVSLHLAAGLTYAAIAERMGVSRPTAIYHAQEVFNKLNVVSRAELQAKLMAL